MIKKITILNIFYLIIFSQGFAVSGEDLSIPFPYLIIVNNDSIPEDLPPINFSKSGDLSNGYYFLSTSPMEDAGNIYSNYNIILDNEGSIKAYKKIGHDFDKIPMNFIQSFNGMLVHTEKTPLSSVVFVSDTALTIKDSIGNIGTMTNKPYLELLPNGHYLKIKSTQQCMDLSHLVENGETNVLVTTSDIYELDNKKNIVFYWRALDYLDLNDSYNQNFENGNPSTLNYLNTNSLEYDFDGNILVSNAYMSEILKIDRLSGDIIWRLGGKNNEFEFIGENENNAPNYFSYQHDIRVMPNGNVTLFDNGVQHPEKYSRAVEYELDESNKTCRLFWEYRHQPDIFSLQDGSVQRLSNGNTVIGWGYAGFDGTVAMTEVDKDKTVLLELGLPFGYKSTSISKHPWAYSSPSGRVSFEILQGNTYNFNKGSQITCTKMKVTELQEIFYPMIFVNKYLFAPLNPEFESIQPPIVHPVRLFISVRGLVNVNVEARFNLSCLGINYNPQEWKVYRRDNAEKGIFEQLETEYDENTGELVIYTSDFGEFIFGIPQPETKPKETILISPKDNEKVITSEPVQLSWSPHGYFTVCKLQISEDIDFNLIVLDTSNLKQLEFEFSGIESGKTYYWRVRTDNGSKTGDWSESRHFIPVPAFFDLTVPDGGEVWKRDSLRKIIRWDKNINDPVKIELFKNGLLFGKIVDSLYCPSGAFSWYIPDYIPEDSTYKIKVSSLVNEDLTDESRNFFTIKNPASGIKNQIENGLIMLQNTPNPFSGNTQFEFKIPVSGKVNLSVYNIMGEKIATILDKELLMGSHKINWDATNLISGQYYYCLQVGIESITNKMTIIK